MMSTAVLRLCGQPDTGPSGVSDQSNERIRDPISPPFANPRLAPDLSIFWEFMERLLETIYYRTIADLKRFFRHQEPSSSTAQANCLDSGRHRRVASVRIIAVGFRNPLARSSSRHKRLRCTSPDSRPPHPCQGKQHEQSDDPLRDHTIEAPDFQDLGLDVRQV
jgi:hypothetical protein